MLRRSITHRFATIALVASCACHSSCGTILHPERIGQPPGRIDPGVVALDGVGLLVFVLPGAIAFAVDFYTGAIYLPPEFASKEFPRDLKAASLVKVRVDPRTLTPRKIEAVVREQTGRDVRLIAGEYVAAPIDSIDELAATADRLAQHTDPRAANAVIFRCQSE